MAKDLEELVLSISADNRQMLRVLKKMEADTTKTTRDVERRFDAMAKNIDGRLAGIGKNAFRGLLGGAMAALGTRELVRLADTWTDLQSRIRNAVGSVELGDDALARLSDTARRTYSALEGTVDSFVANAQPLRDLGYATEQQLDYTEALNNALVISNARGQRAASVQDALAKAMAAGELRGQNLNTVIQQGGRVAQALADGLGTTVSGLRALGAQGKITGRDVVQALTSQMATLRREAEEMPATISDGIQLLENALLEYVGNADQATGVSAKISEALVIMADNFDKTADVALQLAGVIAGALVGRSLAGMIARLGLAGTALINFTRALTAASAMTRLSLGFGGLAAAAGPVGLIIGGAVVSSLVLYSNATAEATAATRTYEEALEAVRAKAREVGDAVENVTEQLDDKAKNLLTRGVERGLSEIERLTVAIEEEVNKTIVLWENMAVANLVTEAQLAELRSIKEGLRDGTVAAEEVEQRLYRLASVNAQFQNVADDISVITTALVEAIAATDLLHSKLAAPGSAAIEAYRQYGQSRVAGNAIEAERNAYEQTALRRAQMGRDQLALENEIARVRNDALKEGITLTDEQVKRIAEANLAGNAYRTSEGRKPKAERPDDYARLAERIRESTGALVAETEVQRSLNPLIDDYGYAVERARAEHELLTAAQKAGLEITPQLRSEIENLADTYATATVEAAKLGETQDEIRRKAEEMRDFQKDLTRGLIDGFIQGKKAADIFADALSKIGNKLLDMALNSAFDSKGGGGGGWLQSLISSIFKREHGGPVRKGVPYVVGEKRPELFVPDSNGTIVPRVPTMPDVVKPNTGGIHVSITMAPQIDNRGASSEAVAKTAAELAKLKAELPARVTAAVRQAQTGRML